MSKKSKNESNHQAASESSGACVDDECSSPSDYAALFQWIVKKRGGFCTVQDAVKKGHIDRSNVRTTLKEISKFKKLHLHLNEGDVFKSIITVFAPKARLCFKYYRNGECNQPSCSHLHLCKAKLSGNCTDAKEACTKNHDLRQGHNQQLVHQMGLSDFSDNEIWNILRSSFLKVCLEHNSDKGCSILSCGGTCPSVHICLEYVKGDCPNSNSCPFGHILDQHAWRLLKNRNMYKLQFPFKTFIKNFIIPADKTSTGANKASCSKTSIKKFKHEVTKKSSEDESVDTVKEQTTHARKMSSVDDSASSSSTSEGKSKASNLVVKSKVTRKSGEDQKVSPAVTSKEAKMRTPEVGSGESKPVSIKNGKNFVPAATEDEPHSPDRDRNEDASQSTSSTSQLGKMRTQVSSTHDVNNLQCDWKTIFSWIVKYQNGCCSLKAVVEKYCIDGVHTDDIIKKISKSKYLLLHKNDGDLMKSIITVYAAEARMCFKYLRTGECEDLRCSHLHLCKAKLSGCCLKTEEPCAQNHDIRRSHSNDLISSMGLDDFTNDEIWCILRNSFLKVCLDYNSEKGCPIQSNDGICPSVHICLEYAVGKCPDSDGDCPYGHSLNEHARHLFSLRRNDAPYLQRIFFKNVFIPTCADNDASEKSIKSPTDLTHQDDHGTSMCSDNASPESGLTRSGEASNQRIKGKAEDACNRLIEKVDNAEKCGEAIGVAVKTSTENPSQFSENLPREAKSTENVIDCSEVFQWILQAMNGSCRLQDVIERHNIDQAYAGRVVEEIFGYDKLRMHVNKVNLMESIITVFAPKAKGFCIPYDISGKCWKNTCDVLHLCGFKLRGCCFKARSGCPRNHDFIDEHNKKIIRKIGLNKLGDDEIWTVLRNTFLTVCVEHNTDGGCSVLRGGGYCPFVHICSKFITKKCNDDDDTCPFGHHIACTNNDWLLRCHGKQSYQEDKVIRELIVPVNLCGVNQKKNHQKQRPSVDESQMWQSSDQEEIYDWCTSAVTTLDHDDHGVDTPAMTPCEEACSATELFSPAKNAQETTPTPYLTTEACGKTFADFLEEKKKESMLQADQSSKQVGCLLF